MSHLNAAPPIRTDSGVFGPRQMAAETAVYRIFDQHGTLLYIGMSVSPETRWADFRTCKRWFVEEAHRWEVAWYSTRAEADAEEKRAIREELPRYNHVHKPRQPASMTQGRRTDLKPKE